MLATLKIIWTARRRFLDVKDALHQDAEASHDKRFREAEFGDADQDEQKIQRHGSRRSPGSVTFMPEASSAMAQ